MIITTITSKLILNRSCKRMGMAGSQGFPVPDKRHGGAVRRWNCGRFAHVDRRYP